jgi:hypothetical protein
MLTFKLQSPLLIAKEEARLQTADFWSTDSEELFVKNSSIRPAEWQWHNTPITYNWNSLGYRTKEIKDLDKDFILTFGCSFTEGIGINVSDIWNHHVSKQLGLNLCNLAKGGTGFQQQYYNSLLWHNSKLQLPTLVIVQWPNKYRKSFGVANTSGDILIRDANGGHTDIDYKWYARRYIRDEGERKLNNFVEFEMFNNIWKMLNVPVLNFTWDNDTEEDLTKSPYKIWHLEMETDVLTDRARDVGVNDSPGHNGPLWHVETSHKLCSILKSGNFTYKI